MACLLGTSWTAFSPPRTLSMASKRSVWVVNTTLTTSYNKQASSQITFPLNLIGRFYRNGRVTGTQTRLPPRTEYRRFKRGSNKRKRYPSDEDPGGSRVQPCFHEVDNLDRLINRFDGSQRTQNKGRSIRVALERPGTN